MKASQLTLWLLGAMLAILIILGGSTLATTNSRFDRLEAKVDFVVQQYNKIDVLEERLKGLQRTIESLPLRFPEVGGR